MKLLFALFLLMISTLTANAQCGQRVFVTNAGYGQASVTFRTGYSDVACAGGVCVVPSNVDGAVAVIPSSTAFFALSNPQVFQFRTRNFIQVSNAIVATDSYGNQIEVVNSGIQPQTIIQSRGQILFQR